VLVTGYDAAAIAAHNGARSTVTYCHRHNLVRKDLANIDRRFGIRVTLPPNDTFSRLLGDEWENLHWYPSEEERDRAFDKMARRHGYYRTTDAPTQILEKIKR
jgi:hypothetical protein